MRLIQLLILVILSVQITACGSFKSKRVDRAESDEKASEITDKWVMKDTELSVQQILGQIQKHRGFQKYLRKLGREPKLFVADVQNRTSEPYFPIDDLNDELLNEFSASGDYVLIDAIARDRILEEIQYQNDGMVSPNEVKSIGLQAGADLMAFGAIRMQPRSRDGKTIKEYSVNIRLTDVERGIEVLRTRVKMNKFSDQSSWGW